MTDLTSLVVPTSVAVIGASARRQASGNQVLANLRRGGYAGAVHVVHHEASEIDGHPTVPSIAELPGPVDVALVSVPASGCVATLAELEKAGCRAAIVPAVGLGPEERLAIEAIRDRSGMAICGPNTMGIHNVTDGISMLFWEDVLDQVRPGPVALVAQSGGACMTVATSTEVAGFSRILASGNEWGVSTSDYLAWLATDDATSAVGIVVESLHDVDGFVAAVRQLREADKRAVVLHAGRTEAGSVATGAHTAALIGRSDVYASFFAELDLPVVRDYDEMAAVLDVLSLEGVPRPRGSSIAVVTVSGGVAAVTADVASDYGIELPELPEGARKALDDVLPGAAPHNPFDAGAAPAYSDVAFSAALQQLGSTEGVDLILAVLDGQSSLSPGEMRVAEEDFVGLADAARSVTSTPIVVASTSATPIHPRWPELVGPRVPIVRGIGCGLRVAQALVMNRRPVPLVRSVPAPAPAAAPRDAAGMADLLEAYELPLVRRRTVVSAEEAALVAPELGFPLVVKVTSAQVAHRTEVGGVVVGVTGVEALRAAIAEIERSVVEHVPDAHIDGYELQEQVSSSIEAMVGFVADPVFGPVVSVGLGGVLVELLGDSAFALAPVTSEVAEELIETTVLARIAAGYRGLFPVTDLRPLAKVVADFSRLAADHIHEFSSGDLNPVILREGSGEAVVVDVLLTPTDDTSPTSGRNA